MRYSYYDEKDDSITINHDKLRKKAKNDREYMILVICEFITPMSKRYHRDDITKIDFTTLPDEMITFIYLVCCRLNSVLPSRYVRSMYCYNGLLTAYNEISERLKEIKNYIETHFFGLDEVGKDLLKLVNGDYERVCSHCSKPMAQGYCIDNGLEYYCSDECLHEHYTDEEYNRLYDDGNGDSYWTEW